MYVHGKPKPTEQGDQESKGVNGKIRQAYDKLKDYLRQVHSELQSKRDERLRPKADEAAADSLKELEKALAAVPLEHSLEIWPVVFGRMDKYYQTVPEPA